VLTDAESRENYSLVPLSISYRINLDATTGFALAR
jgi:hypothetical protein